MKKLSKKLLAVICICLAMVLTFSGCGLNYLLGIRSRAIHFDEMEYRITAAETEQVKQVIIDATEKLETVKNFWGVKKIDNEIAEAVNPFYTKYQVLEIKTYLDNKDENLREMQEKTSDELAEISNLISKYNRVIIEGKYADDYRDWVGDFAFEKIKDDLLLNSDEVVSLVQKRDSLNIEYNKQITEISTMYNGTAYTADTLYTASLSPEEKYIVRDQLYAENAEYFAELYMQMVKLDNERARTLGFDNAAEMYYLTYGRDYSPADSRKYFGYVKEYIIPLVNKYGGFYGMSDYITQKRSTTIKTFVDILPEVNEDMMDCYDFIEKYGLADIKARENKTTDIGFTASLATYDAFFLYMSWDDTFRSTETWIHEFGHSFDEYMSFTNPSYATNLDISEIFSQALVLLMQKYNDDFINEKKYIELANVSQIVDTLLNSIIFQAMLEEFQLTVYENPDMTADEIAQLYQSLSVEYEMASDDIELDHSWYRVTHLFDAPFYTISYCTSANVALQIWSLSQQDWDNALEVYLELMNTSRDKDFLDMLKENELDNPFKEKSFKNIVEMVENEFGDLHSEYFGNETLDNAA